LREVWTGPALSGQVTADGAYDGGGRFIDDEGAWSRASRCNILVVFETTYESKIAALDVSLTDMQIFVFTSVVAKIKGSTVRFVIAAKRPSDALAGAG
jgi:hypothetical protein